MKTALLALWKAKWLLILGIALVSGWLLLTQWLDYRDQAEAFSRPIKARTVKRAQDWPVAPIAGCPAVVELKPPPKERARLERDFGVDLGTGQKPSVPASGGAVAGPAVSGDSQEGVLGEGVLGDSGPHVLGLFTVPPAAYGGEALAVLPESGRLDLTFKLNPPPFISLRPIWGMGALVDPTKPGERWTGYVLVEPLHFREHWHGRATAGMENRDGSTGFVLMVGAEFRTR